MKTKKEQLNTFYEQGDFGYVKERVNSMKIMCEPTFKASDVFFIQFNAWEEKTCEVYYRKTQPWNVVNTWNFAGEGIYL